MAKYQMLWNYTKKKSGEIVIAEEEFQKMLDAAYEAGYNRGIVDGLQCQTEPFLSTKTPTNVQQGYVVTSSNSASSPTE